MDPPNQGYAYFQKSFSLAVFLMNLFMRCFPQIPILSCSLPSEDGPHWHLGVYGTRSSSLEPGGLTMFAPSSQQKLMFYAF